MVLVDIIKKRWVLALGAVAALFVLYSTLGSPGESRDIEYKSVEITRGDVTRTVSATGALSALVTVEVGSQLSGQVTELNADFNSEVKKGDLIALIDPKTFAARVMQAKAELEVARANQAIQEASLNADKAAVREAKADYERKKPLAEQGHVSAADLDRSLAALQTAEARMAMADAQILNAIATVRQREASLNQSEIDLERTRIIAPVDGVVIERNVDIGQTVAASLSAPVLFRIAQNLSDMQVEAQVDEADIGEIEAGNAVVFTVDAYPERKFRGTVRQVRIAPEILNNVVTYTVVIETRNRDLKLLPGMTANAEIVTGESQGVLRVENSALRFRPQGIAAGQAAGQRVGQGGGGGGGGGQFVARMVEQLGLSEEQSKAISDAMREARSSFTGGAPGGSPEELRARFRAQLDRILASILSPDQLNRYRDISANNGQQARRAQLWVRGADGTLEPRTVRIGISDDDNTEVLGGMEEGDVVISGASFVGGRTPAGR